MLTKQQRRAAFWEGYWSVARWMSPLLIAIGVVVWFVGCSRVDAPPATCPAQQQQQNTCPPGGCPGRWEKDGSYRVDGNPKLFQK